MFNKKEKEEKPAANAAEKPAEKNDSPAFTIPVGEKKAEKPFSEKLNEAAKAADVVLEDSDRTLLTDLFHEVHRGYRRNHVVNLYLQRKFVANNKDMALAQSLAQVQNEIKSQEDYMLYLLNKIKG